MQGARDNRIVQTVADSVTGGFGRDKEPNELPGTIVFVYGTGKTFDVTASPGDEKLALVILPSSNLGLPKGDAAHRQESSSYVCGCHVFRRSRP